MLTYVHKHAEQFHGGQYKTHVNEQKVAMSCEGTLPGGLPGPPDPGPGPRYRSRPKGKAGAPETSSPQIRCGVSSRSGDPPARGEAGTPRTSGQFRGLGGGGSPCRDPQPTSCCPYGECPKKCPESTLKVPPKYYKSTLKLSPKYPKNGPFTLNCLLSPRSRSRPLAPPAPFLEPSESGR